MLDLREKIRRFAEILSSNNTVTITTKDRDGNVWSAKVFYADKDGYVYSILEDKGHTLKNIRENPEVFFVIENGNPIRFVQGKGVAEILGPTSSHPDERSLITARNFPIVPCQSRYHHHQNKAHGGIRNGHEQRVPAKVQDRV